MMKKILLIVLLFVSMGVNAQNVKNDGKPYSFYCSLRDATDEIRWNDKVEHLCDENGKSIKSYYTDKFNYMSKRGWEYVDCINSGSEKYYIFKKTVTTDEEAKENLHFKSDLKK